MSNHSVLADLLSPPAWITTIDLADAYFHVPIKATLHKYLSENRALSFRSRSCPPMDGRLPLRMGRSHTLGCRLRVLDSPRGTLTHQSPRSQSGAPLSPSPRPIPSMDTSLYRQRASPMRNQQAILQIAQPPQGGDQFSPSSPASLSKDQGLPHIYPPQCQGRRPQPHFPPTPRMGTSTEALPSAPTSQRSPRDRPHGQKRELEATSIYITPSSPPSMGSQCSSLGLEPMVSDLHISPEVAHSSRHNQTSNLQIPRPDSSTMVPSGALVPIHPQQITRSLESEPLGPNETWTSRLRELDRIPFLKEVFSAKWGDTVASRLTTAHRTSTARQAQSVWDAFKRWLPPSLTTISTQTLMEFLIHCEDNRCLNPRTFLNYRS